LKIKYQEDCRMLILNLFYAKATAKYQNVCKNAMVTSDYNT